MVKTRTGYCDISGKLCFQQGGATAHMAYKLMCCLRAMLPGHSILHSGAIPGQSSLLTSLYWGHLTTEV